MVIKTQSIYRNGLKNGRDQLVAEEVKLSEFSFQSGSKDGSLKNGLTLVIKNQPVILLKVKRWEIQEWYDNGKKYVEQEYKDGKAWLNVQLVWHWIKKEQKYYTMDIINGIHLQWYDNGQKNWETILMGNMMVFGRNGLLMVKNLLKVSIMKIC